MKNILNITPHLKKSEIECSCGCGYAKLDIAIAVKFEIIRYLAGNKSIDVYGSRCWDNHVAIYRSLGLPVPPKSLHLEGKALDLTCPENMDYDKFYEICESVIGDDGGVGKYKSKNFVHIDIRGYKARWNG